jgi:hypothetical protein
VPEILNFIARRLNQILQKMGLHKKSMVRAADTLNRHKNPGNDAAGVVGGDVTRSRYAGRDVQVASATPGFLTLAQEEMPAGDKFDVLEVQLDAKLELSSRTNCSRDAIEIGVCNLPIRNAPSWTVEEIESFKPELPSDSFRNGELLEQ